ncbi:hypothetical protein MTBSS4_230048 [Magnetospirillum sp. SS-4]|nr:hypothetical protein MTBSS4_230048 [Magnetospirillum sp. SS-4]
MPIVLASFAEVGTDRVAHGGVHKRPAAIEHGDLGMIPSGRPAARPGLGDLICHCGFNRLHQRRGNRGATERLHDSEGVLQHDGQQQVLIRQAVGKGPHLGARVDADVERGVEHERIRAGKPPDQQSGRDPFRSRQADRQRRLPHHLDLLRLGGGKGKDQVDAVRADPEGCALGEHAERGRGVDAESNEVVHGLPLSWFSCRAVFRPTWATLARGVLLVRRPSLATSQIGWTRAIFSAAGWGGSFAALKGPAPNRERLAVGEEFGMILQPVQRPWIAPRKSLSSPPCTSFRCSSATPTSPRSRRSNSPVMWRRSASPSPG